MYSRQAQPKQPQSTTQTATKHSPNSHPIQSALPTKSSPQATKHCPHSHQAQPTGHLTAALEEKTRRYPWFSDKFFRKLQSLTPHRDAYSPPTNNHLHGNRHLPLLPVRVAYADAVLQLQVHLWQTAREGHLPSLPHLTRLDGSGLAQPLGQLLRTPFPHTAPDRPRECHPHEPVHLLVGRMAVWQCTDDAA